MNKAAILAIVDAIIRERLTEKDTRGIRGPRGFKGTPGADFNFKENELEILGLIKKTVVDNKDLFNLKFSELNEKEKEFLKLKLQDLSLEDIEKLSGPEGKPGKDFKFSQHKDKIFSKIEKTIDSIKDEFKLRFSNLTDQEKEEIRGQKGPRGQRGKPGKDFDLEENKELIEKAISDQSNNFIGPKGPRGLAGRPGKDFDFEENKENIKNIVEDKKEFLRLNFSDLTEEEKSELKIKFSDFSEKEIQDLKGPRGSRGQKGKSGAEGKSAFDVWSENNEGTEDDYLNSLIGEKGEKGERGERGVRGPIGMKGLNGGQGLSGRDGKDAPTIIDIEVSQKDKKTFKLIFHFSDGKIIETKIIDIPVIQSLYQSFMGGGGGGSSSGGLAAIAIMDDGIAVGDAKTLNFINSTATVDGSDPDQINITPDATCIEVDDESVLVTDCVTKMNFIGDNVQVVPQSVIADWPTMDVVNPISSYAGSDPGAVDVHVFGVAEKLSKSFIAGEPIALYQFVRLDASQEAFKATNNSTFEEAQAVGIALDSVSTGAQVSILLFGLYESGAFSFTVNNPFFLGVNGAAIQNPPTATGEFVVELGQSLGPGAIFLDIARPAEIIS